MTRVVRNWRIDPILRILKYTQSGKFCQPVAYGECIVKHDTLIAGRITKIHFGQFLRTSGKSDDLNGPNNSASYLHSVEAC